MEAGSNGWNMSQTQTIWRADFIFSTNTQKGNFSQKNCPTATTKSAQYMILRVFRGFFLGNGRHARARSGRGHHIQ